jgi:hypothetical protein
MDEERVRQIVRQFPENGLKQVLGSAGNVRDLLTLAKAAVLPRIDLGGMQIDPTTYVTAEYRHVSSDLVLRAGLRPSAGRGRRKPLTVTILIELQSQPDRLMPLRVLEYLVQVWKHQVKQHGQTHRSLASVKLRPVLPVVVHTGSYAWEKLGGLLDLMEDAEAFRPFTPAFEPLFVSLPNTPEAELEKDGGPFGQVLALLRASTAGRGPFARRLAQTLARLQELKGPDRLRRLELLCYVEGLVYHARAAAEHETLRRQIDAAVRDDEGRLEVEMARRTLADVHREQASLEAVLNERKRTLLLQLRLRFKAVPPKIERTIQSTADSDQLEVWLTRFATAEDLDSIVITSH